MLKMIIRKEISFLKGALPIAIPVSIVSLVQTAVQTSVDQIMISHMGKYSIAGVGLVGKYLMLFSTLVNALMALTNIMVSQSFGKRDIRRVNQSISVNLTVVVLTSFAFVLLSCLFAPQIMGLYTKDPLTHAQASEYLRVVVWQYVPVGVGSVFATVLHCKGKSVVPMAAGVFAVIINIFFNWCLIYGNLGFPAMGLRGAGYATVFAMVVSVLIQLIYHFGDLRREDHRAYFVVFDTFDEWVLYFKMLIPIIFSGVSFSLSRNVFAIIYAHMGTTESAGVSMLTPVTGTVSGFLMGFTISSSLQIGKLLGKQSRDCAFRISKAYLFNTLIISLLFSAGIVLLRDQYINLFDISAGLKEIMKKLMISCACIVPLSALNMVLSSGIIKSGGKTNYILYIDLIGNWLFGVPLAMGAAFWLKLPVEYVFLIAGADELARLLISLLLFQKKTWMQTT